MAEADKGIARPGAQVPTLLVGLGGIGGQVVERVFERIPATERGRVVMHVVDTNALDLEGLEYLRGPDSQTQLGSMAPIAQYQLEMPATNGWFPYHPVLNAKSTLEGAGQVRAVSRLTFADLLRRPGRLAGMRAAVEKLFRLADDGGRDFLPRVIVVNSWAGGTGAGAFISVALFVKNLMNELQAGPARFIVRGFFVMPDVLVNPGVLPSGQWENVRGNAMACLKELEGIRMGQLGETDNVRLEFSFGGEATLVPEMPYDYFYLFDHQNREGQTLSGMDDYLDQVVRCLHLSLFSPLGKAQFSSEDNLIRQLIESNDRARYGGAATASLVYPYAGLLDYLSHRWAAESLGEQWLRIERDWKRELESYERDLTQGIVRQRLKRGDHFRRHFGELAAEKRPPFWQLHKQAFVLDQDERPRERIAEAWLGALVQDLTKQLRLNAPAQLALDSRELRRAESLESAVSEAERQIYLAWQEVQRFVGEVTPGLVARALTRDGEEAILQKGEGRYRMNYWLFDEERTARHPLAVRHILYDAEELLDLRLAQLRDEVRRLRAGIDAYDRIYDLDETPDLVDKPADRIRRILGQPALRRVLSRDLAGFARLYESEAHAQYGRILSYAQASLKEEVLRRVLAGIRTFITEWERFFGELRGLMDDLELERNRFALEHEDQTNPTIVNVLATRAHKETLWTDLAMERASANEGTELGNIAYETLYDRLCRELRRDPTHAHIASSFREALLGRYRELLTGSSLPSDIYSALTREAKLQRVAPSAHAKRHLQGLTELASPYFQVNLGADHTPFRFFGLPPGADALGQKALAGLGGNTREDPAFPNTEIVYYAVQLGFKAEQLAKFTPGLEVENVVSNPGVYYQAYQAQVARMREQAQTVVRRREETTITPHLDKDWHDLLPDFWVAGTSVVRALILGIAHGRLRADGTNWRCDGTVLCPQQKSDLEPLEAALENRSDLVVSLLEGAQQAALDDAGRYGDAVHRHAFVRGVRAKPLEGAMNLLDLAALQLRVRPSRSKAEREADANRWLTSVRDLIRGYIKGQIGDSAHAQTRSQAILKGLLEKSSVLQGQGAREKGFRNHVLEMLKGN